MFKNLLVPLDGSPMAESALPAAAYLAEKLGANVTLMHCIERDAPEKVHGERHLSKADEARAYLQSASASIGGSGSGARTTCHTHEAETADVARSVVAHAEKSPASLIVLCTHGKSGLGKLLLGSIAQRVVGFGTTPVLLVPPSPAGSPARTEAFAIRKLLVPLDGREPHEEALSAAGELARACDAAIHLLFVVATRRSLPHTDAAVGLLLPRATHAVLEIARQEAEEYLARQAACQRAGGYAVTTEVRRGDASQAIAAAAKRSAADVIIMATHRKGAMGAFWAGSVAPRVASYADRPLLLVPIGMNDVQPAP